MQPPQQQPMGAPGPGPYYGYPTGPAMPMVIGKKMVFLGNGLAVLLVWISLLVLVLATGLDATGFRAIGALYLFGTLLGFGACLMGALGSPRTNDSQNLGLIVLAGLWLVAMIFGPIAAIAIRLP